MLLLTFTNCPYESKKSRSRKISEEATDPNEKEMYIWLSDWEIGHHKILYDLNEALNESIWFE